ncbi:chemotaxis protein CheB [Marinospirillum alkaliphilum]|nr:chemotaxis protein CheB [Marinospirillum alkaliphilum]
MPERKSQRRNTQQPYWIAVGASAGGLEALKEFLGALDKADDTIIIIAQHLDPRHPTILKDLLARATPLPVELVDQELTPRPGHVYIVAPGHNALIEKGRILLQPAAATGPKPSINLLLSSLAEDIGEQAIAVILSGTGTDGSQGIMAIKSANGLVLAQDETTAKYSGMPKAAIDTGFVDLTLPPAAIAAEITNFIASAGKTLSKVSAPRIRSSLEKIYQRILDQTGYDFSGYKLKTIQRRIARRMAVHRLVTLDDYVTLIASSHQEVESLFKDLLISVTSFFRDTEAFADLAGLINQLIEQNADNHQIRVWVPGCANGEEAFSIAILFHQASLLLRKEVSYQIFATDIDEHAMSLARKGIYTTAQVRDVPADLLELYFINKDGQYHVRKVIRDQVVFARQNVIMDPPFSRLDLISCRNLLIYFSLELQKQVLQTFHFALKPGHYLFLGKSESASSAVPELFDPLISKSQIFVRKKTNLSTRLDHISSAVSMASSRHKQEQRERPLLQEKHNIAARIDQILVEQLLPTAVVIDSSGQVLHLRGDVSLYLSFPQGRIDTNLLNLIRDDLKVDVRALLQKARRDGKASCQSLFYENSQPEKALFLNLKRMQLEEAEELYCLTFQELDLSESFITSQGVMTDGDQLINDKLRKEIAIFKERLQNSIEDLETTNEELQSTNEELQSANEELQSANEELQTANEELQSTNEELSTVNQELEVKTYELEQVNNDLENMLAQMNEFILLVDNRLRVQRFTQIAGQLLGLDNGDIGQVITTLALRLELPNLRQELLNIIESGQPGQQRVRHQDQVYQVRMVPYTADSNKVVGVMLFFEQHREQLNASECESLALLKMLSAQPGETAKMLIDQTGVIIYADHALENLFGYPVDAMLYRNIKTLMPEPYNRHHDSYIQAYLTEKTKGLVGKWRDITALTAEGERRLLKIKVEAIQLKGEPHFLGFMKLLDADDECQ